MASDDFVSRISEKRHIEAEGFDARSDMGDLRRGMGSWVCRRGF
jgi:hypothetical protein